MCSLLYHTGSPQDKKTHSAARAGDCSDVSFLLCMNMICNRATLSKCHCVYPVTQPIQPLSALPLAVGKHTLMTFDSAKKNPFLIFLSCIPVQIVSSNCLFFSQHKLNICCNHLSCFMESFELASTAKQRHQYARTRLRHVHLHWPIGNNV